MANAALMPIPWRFVDAGLTRMWIWDAEHFEAKVSAEGNSFAWEIGDKILPTQGLPRFLCEGRTGDFASAENGVREAVGKSYAARLGYGPYVGAFATTFVISDGTRVDLGEFNGQGVVVTVRLSNGLTRTVMGSARVVNWELHVEDGASKSIIQPAHIASIVREGGGGASSLKGDYTGMGRLYRGTVVRGCTGVPGFMDGTVDHLGPSCPMHESRSVSPIRLT